MTKASLILGGPEWIWPTVLLAAVTLALVVWSYRRTPGSVGVRLTAALLKTAGIVILLVCLIEPLLQSRRPRPGANLLVVLVDDSQSLRIRDPDSGRSGLEQLNETLQDDAAWHTRVSQSFDVRRYRFADRLQPLDETDGELLTASGNSSSLMTALDTVAGRFQGQPLAGIVVLTDGNATDLPIDTPDWSHLPPVYPVPIGSQEAARDVRLGSVNVSQTNFEQAPVTIRAEVLADGYEGESLSVELLDSDRKLVDRTTVTGPSSGEPRVVRFQLRPETAGTTFYSLRTSIESEKDALDASDGSTEATLVNNTRTLLVDSPGGPFRVLYVSGRVNWEFKFLRRSLEPDTEVNLVGLIRVAKREPKFSFLSRDGESTNPLYRGFEHQDVEVAEQYDEPVFVRLGTRDEAELRTGFPKTADVLYEYDAVILDDIEAEFFTQDQMLLLQKFVSVRGGGLLMLGGAESFYQGEYARTPIGEMLPVYLRKLPETSPGSGYRLQLTREGRLQPWVRLRETEEAEQGRLEAMPTFATINRTAGIKPGAAVLANVTDDEGRIVPSLVTQRFGRGRSGALLLGDMWRWSLQREEGHEDDLAKAWRQTVRWLVADVPGRIELETHRITGMPGAPIRFEVKISGPEYEPMDNAKVVLTITSPSGKEHVLTAEPSSLRAGIYQSSYLPRESGGYHVSVMATAADGSEVGTKRSGWTSDPASEEFRRLTPDLDLLKRIAEQTGGEVIEPDQLERFAKDLPNRDIPITEPWIHPLWHGPFIFLLAIGCLLAEWGLRRYKGMP